VPHLKREDIARILIQQALQKRPEHLEVIGEARTDRSDVKSLAVRRGQSCRARVR
jgi:hypothetical protein